jgi:xylulose-5-phosphate/fructose-6-phosphate phosphoketolase
MFVFDEKLSTVVDATKNGDRSSPRPAHGPLSPEMLEKMHRYWQAANYLTVGQIYLQENPLL